MKKAFTLIELLVVVLIIGILAAVALPQYEKAVEKSRLTEGLQLVDTIKKNMYIYVMENGYPSTGLSLEDFPKAIELSGGTYNEEGYYVTKYFELYSGCNCVAGKKSSSCSCEVYRRPGDDYAFYINKKNGDANWTQKCWTNETDIGRYICKSLESHGWDYTDGVF